MDSITQKSKQIFMNHGEEKVICNIINKNFRFTFTKSDNWAFPLIISSSSILVLISLFVFIPIYFRVMLLLIFLISLLFTIYSFLSNSCSFYFDDHYLVLENKLKKKNVIDINKYPRIYIRQRIFDSYNRVHDRYEIKECYFVYIEQNNNQFIFDMHRCGNDNICKLFDSIETKSKSNCSTEEWNCSSNDRYNIFSNYYIKQRIIGVKNPTLNMKIPKTSNIPFCLLVFLSIVLAIAIFDNIIHKLDITIWLMLLYIPIFIGIITDRSKHSIKISYPLDGSIQINKYFLDYKNTDVSLKLVAIQRPDINDKFSYVLNILEQDSSYSIPLDSANEYLIKDFFDNLILAKP